MSLACTRPMTTEAIVNSDRGQRRSPGSADTPAAAVPHPRRVADASPGRERHVNDVRVVLARELEQPHEPVDGRVDLGAPLGVLDVVCFHWLKAGGAVPKPGMYPAQRGDDAYSPPEPVSAALPAPHTAGMKRRRRAADGADGHTRPARGDRAPKSRRSAGMSPSSPPTRCTPRWGTSPGSSHHARARDRTIGAGNPDNRRGYHLGVLDPLGRPIKDAAKGRRINV